jgi:hypothetical protein
VSVENGYAVLPVKVLRDEVAQRARGVFQPSQPQPADRRPTQ